MPETVPEAAHSSKEFQSSALARLDGGLVTFGNPWDIEDNQWNASDNMVVRDGIARTDLGYAQTNNNPHVSGDYDLIGDGRFEMEHISTAGVRKPFLVTDLTAFIYITSGSTDHWQLVSRGVSNTLAVGLTGGEATITLTSAASFNAAGHVGVLDDGAIQYYSTYTKSGNILTLGDAIPVGFTAAIGNAVIDGPVFMELRPRL